MNGQADGDGKGLPMAEGMSLRDYFAAHVPLTPAELFYVAEVSGPDQHGREAGVRYAKADALLAERSKRS